VLPKRPPAILGRWHYDIRYDNLMTVLLVLSAFGSSLLRELGARLRQKKLGWGIVVVFGVQLCIAAIMLPVRSQSREIAMNRPLCISHLQRIGQLIDVYADAHGGQFLGQFADLLAMEEAAPTISVCLSSRDDFAKGETMQALLQDFARPGRWSYIYRGADAKKPLRPGFVRAWIDPTITTTQGFMCCMAMGQ
jgi:hypothetical protein